MNLRPGDSLAHYRLVEPIGAGGMGVVWKAEDTKLGRRVAIKVLPADLSEDRQRLGRFEREAKLLAALNHPNVAAIYGLEQAEGLHFLVLELIDGPSLGQMTKTGPLPLEEALDVARQVAEGLAAAHAAGVIHRDLKPANIVVTPDGKAKVLDFGLAKGVEGALGEDSGSDLSMSPTITIGGTQAGVVLGTAPYMSPEQARGKTLDKRTDIWSFGCLLYECLAGKLAFTGETVTDTLSAILQNEPDWSALPQRTPPRVRYLLERCLEKSPRNRLHDAADARIELEKALASKEWTTSGFLAAAGGVPRRRSKRRLAAAVLVLAVAIMGIVAGWSLKGRAEAGASVRSTIRLSIDSPPDLQVKTFRVSQDGRTILLDAVRRDLPEPERTRQLSSRRLDEFEIRPVAGADGYRGLNLSPDGRWIAMIKPVSPGAPNLELVKVAAAGNVPAVKIADWPADLATNFLWSPRDEIVALASQPYRLYRFPTDGRAAPAPVTLQGDDTSLPDVYLHSALPGGRHVLASAQEYAETGWRESMVLIDLETGNATRLVEDAFLASWSPTGHILFSRRDKLLAVPFDLDTLAVTGPPVALLDGLERNWQFRYSFFDCSQTGTLAYVPSEGEELERGLVLVQPDGGSSPWSDEKKLFIEVSASRDGRRVAAQVQNAGNDNYEIWVSDPGEKRLRAAFAGAGMDFSSAVWSPGGDRIAFRRSGSKDRNGIFIGDPDSSSQPVQVLAVDSAAVFLGPVSFTADGSGLLLGGPASGGQQLMLLPLSGQGGSGSEPKVILSTEISPRGTHVSPDGRWLTYSSSKSGRSEIYLREIPAGGGLGRERLVSRDGGTTPIPAPDAGAEGRKLYFLNGDQLMTSTVSFRPDIAISDPLPVMDLSKLSERDYTLLPGGRILLIQGRPEDEEVKRTAVVVNFQDEIRRTLAEAAGTASGPR